MICMRAYVNPVRNSSRCDSKPSGALNPAGIIIKPNSAAEQRGIISNGVNEYWIPVFTGMTLSDFRSPMSDI